MQTKADVHSIKADIRAGLTKVFPRIGMNHILFGNSAQQPEYERRNKYRETPHIVFAKVALFPESEDFWLYIEVDELAYYDLFVYFKGEYILSEFYYQNLEEPLALLKGKFASLKTSLESVTI